MKLRMVTLSSEGLEEIHHLVSGEDVHDEHAKEDDHDDHEITKKEDMTDMIMIMNLILTFG